MAPRGSRSKRRKAEPSEEVDFISKLPVNVREKILTYLPIKEAGRTSVLSSTWRHTWTSIPELVIQTSHAHHCNTTRLVDTILLLHDAPIHKFDLQTRARRFTAFDRWIRHLSRNGIRDLKLGLDSNSRYKVPSSFFSCKKLTSVSLQNCSIKLPAGFEGFKFLQTLLLKSVTISGDSIKKLVSCCPMLENLMLHNYGNCTVLTIEAPNLRNLDIYGMFTALHLHTPKLLTLNAHPVNLPVENYSSRTNLKQVFSCVPNLESLVIRAHFVEFLTNGDVVKKFPVILQNMKKLVFDLDVSSEKGVALLLAVLQNTPNLEILEIQMNFDWDTDDEQDDNSELPIPNYWEKIGQDFSMKHLRIVNLEYFQDEDKAIAFVKFLLGSTPELLKLTIGDCSCFSEGYNLDTKAASCLKQLLQFRRASTKAQIFIE